MLSGVLALAGCCMIVCPVLTGKSGDYARPQ
jgi:hypothetical protein